MSGRSAEQPYGELVGSTCTVLTWNVWGRFGPWRERGPRLAEVIAAASPDVVALQEAWAATDGTSQADELAARLGYDHVVAADRSLTFGDWGPVSAILSRWPLERPAEHALGEDLGDGWPGVALAADVAGPRGTIPFLNVALDWPPHAGGLRQRSVRRLAELVTERAAAHRFPAVVCGDFNTGPQSAEMRMLTGLDEVALAGFVLFDAWEKAGEGDGVTWDRHNPWAAPTLLPSKRIDHVLCGWPGRGGVGDAVRAERVGLPNGDEPPPSDHYGVVVDLRY